MSKSVGQKLRQAREMRSITLEGAAQVTRIRPHYLQALEAGEFDTLPSQVQARGFLRAYADYLELDSRALLAALDEEKGLKRDTKVAPISSPRQANPAPVPDTPEAESGAEISPDDQIFTDIGERLRKQRELLGLSLDDIERHTHLRRHYLVALEEGNMDGLPSPVQGRGMLNNYASFVGLDPEPLLLRFADGLQARLAARQAARPEIRPAPAKRPPRGMPAPLRRILSGDVLIGGTLVVFLVIFVFWGTIRIFAITSNQEPTATAPSIADVLLASATPTPTFTPAPVTPTAPRATQFQSPTGVGTNVGPGQVLAPSTPGKSQVQVYVTVNQRAWLQVLVDQNVEFEGRVLPGSAYTFVGETQIELLTGNAAAINVFYNGIDLGVMGAYGQVASRVYSTQGILTPTPVITDTPAAPTPETSATPPGEPVTPPPLP